MNTRKLEQKKSIEENCLDEILGNKVFKKKCSKYGKYEEGRWTVKLDMQA